MFSCLSETIAPGPLHYSTSCFHCCNTLSCEKGGHNRVGGGGKGRGRRCWAQDDCGVKV